MIALPEMRGHVFRGPLLVLLVGSCFIVGSRLLPMDDFLSPATDPQSLPLADTAETIAENAPVAVPEEDVAVISEEQRPGDSDGPAVIDETAAGLDSPIPADAAAEAARLAEQEAQRMAEADARRQVESQRKREAEAVQRRLAEVERQAEQEAQQKREAEETARRERQIAAAREAERAARRQREAEAAAAAREAELAEQQRLAAEAAEKSKLRAFVEADVDDRAGLGDFTSTGYSAKLKAELILVAQETLGADAVATGGDNMAFRKLIRLGRNGLEQLCEQAGSTRVLLADVVIESAGFSVVDSAYWPQLQMAAIDCDAGSIRRGRKQRLEPHRLDRFGFQQSFSERSREFISSQGYFLGQ